MGFETQSWQTTYVGDDSSTYQFQHLWYASNLNQLSISTVQPYQTSLRQQLLKGAYVQLSLANCVIPLGDTSHGDECIEFWTGSSSVVNPCGCLRQETCSTTSSNSNPYDSPSSPASTEVTATGAPAIANTPVFSGSAVACQSSASDSATFCLLRSVGSPTYTVHVSSNTPITNLYVSFHQTQVPIAFPNAWFTVAGVNIASVIYECQPGQNIHCYYTLS